MFLWSQEQIPNDTLPLNVRDAPAPLDRPHAFSRPLPSGSEPGGRGREPPAHTSFLETTTREAGDRRRARPLRATRDLSFRIHLEQPVSAGLVGEDHRAAKQIGAVRFGSVHAV